MNIVVAGPMHSGTSLVAGTLRHLGVFMGDTFKDVGTHEDTLFAVHEYSPELVAYIQQRNRDHATWGFKWPMLRNWFKSIEPFLLDPKYVYCHRDPYKKIAKYGNGCFAAYLAESSFWGTFFQKREFLVIDFDMLQQERIDALVDFLQLTPSSSQLEKALEFYNTERGYNAVC